MVSKLPTDWNACAVYFSYAVSVATLHPFSIRFIEVTFIGVTNEQVAFQKKIDLTFDRKVVEIRFSRTFLACFDQIFV